jgi:hypothetical protein
MRIMALTSLKGAGKCVAANLAYLAGERPVVVIDLDVHAPLIIGVGRPERTVARAGAAAEETTGCALAPAPVLAPMYGYWAAGAVILLPLVDYLPTLCEQIAATPIEGKLPPGQS